MPTMLDNIDPSQLLPGADADAGYVGGNWPDDNAEKARFPSTPNLSIAVNSQEDAMCLDIERGDADIPDAPVWFHRQVARGLAKPWFYISLSRAQQLVNFLTSAGIPRSAYWLWTAHYSFTAHLCSSACGFGFTDHADGTQWTDRDAGNDESLISDAFLAAIRAANGLPAGQSTAPAPAPVAPARAPDGNPYTPLAVDGLPNPMSAPCPLKGHAYNTIKALQWKLEVEHANAGTIDGMWGPLTCRALQLHLNYYSPISVDGILGPQTISALQRHVGTAIDGHWGPLTTQAMQRMLNAGTF